MRILFDHGTPAPLLAFLPGHEIVEARDLGWDRLANGLLLTAAERAGFEVFLTGDKNIRYQHNLSGRKIALVVLSTPQWPVVQLHSDAIAAAVNAANPGSYCEVDMSTQPYPISNT